MWLHVSMLLHVSMGLNVSLNLTTFIHRTLCALWYYMCPRDCMCTRLTASLPVCIRKYLPFETTCVHGIACILEIDCLYPWDHIYFMRLHLFMGLDVSMRPTASVCSFSFYWPGDFRPLVPFETVWIHVISLGLANSTQPIEQNIRIHSCDIYYIRYGAHPP